MPPLRSYSGLGEPLIAAVHFNTQKLFVRAVFTHKEYERWAP